MTQRTGLTKVGEGRDMDRSSSSEVDAFLSRVKASARTGTGRLIFAMDATMSRQPSWDTALHQQSAMFNAVDSVGTLDVQLVYFRGFRECRASKWVSDTRALRRLMEGITVRGGRTQIGKVLSHALKEHGARPISALVYVGDAMEERVDELCERAGQLGLQRVPCFMFHEGRDVTASSAFKEIARLSNGAYVRLDDAASDRLAELLAAVAAYSSGGLKALEARGGRSDRLLLEQLKR